MYRFFFIVIMLLLHWGGASAQGGTTRPDAFPSKTNPEATDAIYSQENAGNPVKILFSDARKYFGAQIISQASAPSASGNAESIRNKLVQVTADNTIWFVDGAGIGVKVYDPSSAGGGTADGVATAGTLDVANQEIDLTVASPGSNFSISLANIANLAAFSGWDTDASNDFSGAFGDLSGIPAGLADGDDVNDADADPTNEIQTVAWNAGTRVLTLSSGGGSVTITDGTGTDDQTAAEVSYDNSTSLLATSTVQGAIDLLENEIDAVSAGAADGVATAGTLDVANQEIDLTVASPGSNFSISLANIANLSAFSGWDTDASDDFDGAWSSLTGVPEGLDDGDNQALSLSANTLSLVNGGSVNLAPYLDNTDAQTLSLAGANLSISGGNTISLAGLGDGTGTDDQTAAEVPYTDNSLIGETDVQGAIDYLVAEQANFDQSPTNEGLLSVQAGTSTTALIESNTATSPTITLAAGSEVAITENTGTNTITISAGADIVQATANRLPNSTPFSIDLQNKWVGISELQMASAPSPLTLTVSNPRNGGVYTFHFLGVTTNDVVFPANFYNADETSLGTVSFTASDFLTCYYSGANFYCK